MAEPATKRKQHRKPDPEIVVMRRLLDILEPFTPPERKRILDFALARVADTPAQPSLPNV